MASFIIKRENKNLKQNLIHLVDDLHLVKNILKPGYWNEVEYPETVAMNQLSSRHLYVSGSFTETTGEIPPCSAGMISTDIEDIIAAGTYRRETADGCVMWCVRNYKVKGGRVDHADIIALTNDQTLTIPQGHNLFVLEGSVKHNARQLTTNKLYRCETNAVDITAQELSYVLVWQPQA